MAALNTLLPFCKYGLPLMSCVLVGAYVLLARRPQEAVKGLLAALLTATTLLAVYSYTERNWRTGSYLNKYEFYHYYLGAKYAPELGYTGLYAATLVSEAENNFKQRTRTIRDLDQGGMLPASSVLREKGKYTAKFSEARWKSFVQDVSFFHEGFSTKLWQRMLTDKGFNGTPVWLLAAGPLSNLIPTSSGAGMTFLAFLDVFLIMAAVGCVMWAFGYRVGLLLLIFFCTHYLASHATLRAAFLRLDWVMCLVMAVCFIKKGYYRTAGALTAYAALARIFPVVFAFGMGGKALWCLVRDRKLPRRYLSYFGAFVIAGALLVGASVLYTGGLETWRSFLGKIGAHNDDISAWRVGFKYVFLMAYSSHSLLGANHQQAFEDLKLVWWGIQGIVLLLSWGLLRDLEDDEAMAFGFVPTFFLVAATYYYYVMLVVPFLFFAGKLERPTRAAGILLMFTTSMIGHWLYGRWDRSFPLFFAISCLILGMVIYMMCLAMLEILRQRRLGSQRAANAMPEAVNS